MYLDFMTDYNALYESYLRIQRVSGWKESVQKIGINLLPELRKLQNKIQSGYVPDQQTEFTICEQGHLRLVRALKQEDMIIQHALCQSVLIPILKRYLIHDNGASLEGKGISFTRRRFEQHLSWHYRRYGREGYVLKIDFKKYFDNIDHTKLIRAIAEKVPDGALLQTVWNILMSNCPDVSYDARSINELMTVPYSSLDHAKVSRGQLTGQKYLPKSLGIGSPLSQIAGIFYPTRIDNYCKTVKSIHCYDAYMDDRVVIHPDKQYLKDLLGEIDTIAQEMGLFIHPNKTQIVKLSHGITFLKVKYSLTETGHIVRRLPRETIVRERRKLKALARLVDDGRLTISDFDNQYLSWRGDRKRYDAHRTLRYMENLHRRLRSWLLQQQKNRKQSCRKSRKSSTCAATSRAT